ncbi:MAG TPA: hypothetical protein VLZ28_00950 [Daejeonella sp.]|nr:hypothetical protein [Daejeonella sp.]
MFKADKFIVGAIFGLAFPVLAYLSVEILKFDVQVLGKKYLLYIASVVINLIAVRIYFRNDKMETASGVVFSTFISALLFVILKWI